MKLPASVKIGPYDYAVVFEEKVLGGQNQELYGHITFGPQQVKIQSGLSEDRTLTVLIHEALHGLDELLCLNLSEKQVVRLAPALVAFLRDNGLLALPPAAEAEKEQPQ